MKVIIDTNFIISVVNFKIDPFSEFRRIINTNYTLHILDGSMSELNKLLTTLRGKEKRATKLAMSMLELKNVNIIKTKQAHVDDEIINLTSKNPKEYLVATQDLGLKKRLREAQVHRIVIRKKSYFEIV